MSRRIFVSIAVLAATITAAGAGPIAGAASTTIPAKSCVPKPATPLKLPVSWQPGYPEQTEFFDGGAYRVTRCLPSGRPAISVTAAPIVLPDGETVYVPSEIVNRFGTKALFRAYGDKKDPLWVSRFKKALPKLQQEVLPPAPTSTGVIPDPAVSNMLSPPNAQLADDSSCSDSGYNLFGENWLLKSRSLDYYVNVESLPGGTRTRRSIEGAHRAWTDSLNNCGLRPQHELKLSLLGETVRRAGYTADGYNVIDFGNLTEIDGCGDIAAIACAVVTASKDAGIVEADIRFADDLKWSNFGAKDAYDIRSNATHEIGHTIGLADFYGHGHDFATMYAYGGVGQLRGRTLGRGDILGLRALYPRE